MLPCHELFRDLTESEEPIFQQRGHGMELDSDLGPNSAFTSLLEHPEFEFKLFRQLGMSYYGASTLEECLTAARGMDHWDLDGWTARWAEVASDVRRLADEALERRHVFSATEAFLRAANYYQLAEYYAIVAGGDHPALGQLAAQCFELALRLLPWGGGSVTIGENGQSHPAYFLCPDDSGTARPTLLLVSGFEGSAEEQYFCHGVTALRRGYNVLLFQGPGQAGALRSDRKSQLRHDFEIPLQVALDFLHDRPEVDRDRIALCGSGLGSYFSTRVTAFDPRVKALIVNPSFVEMQQLMREMIGHRALIVDVEMQALSEMPPSLMRGDVKLLVINMCRRFGVRRLQALLQETEAYTVRDLLYRVHCPVLSVRSEAEYQELKRQGDVFLSEIRAVDKTEAYLPSVHPTDAHHHFSNLPRLNQVVFDWLDERFQHG